MKLRPRAVEKSCPPKGYCWRVKREKFDEMVLDNRIWFGKDGNNVPSIKRFLSEVKDGVVAMTLWTHQEAGHTQDAKREVISFSDEIVFDTPKPTKLMQRIINIGANSDSVILDYFAGSGTTGHAVINLNREDGGKRKYILVEMGRIL